MEKNVKTYKVRLERDESGAWLAHVPEVPGCHTYARSLRQARNRIREALSLWVDDAETAELVFSYHFPPEWQQTVREYRQARASAIQADRLAQVVAASVAKELTENRGLSLRDAAELLGLSHQRVQQLVAERRSFDALRQASRAERKRMLEHFKELERESAARA